MPNFLQDICTSVFKNLQVSEVDPPDLQVSAADVFRVVNSGRADLLQQLLSEDFDTVVKAVDEATGDSVLHCAAGSRHHAMTNVLIDILDEKAPQLINQTNHNNYSPLDSAIKQGSLEVMAKLVKVGGYMSSEFSNAVDQSATSRKLVTDDRSLISGFDALLFDASFDLRRHVFSEVQALHVNDEPEQDFIPPVWLDRIDAVRYLSATNGNLLEALTLAIADRKHSVVNFFVSSSLDILTSMDGQIGAHEGARNRAIYDQSKDLVATYLSADVPLNREIISSERSVNVLIKNQLITAENMSSIIELDSLSARHNNRSWQ